MEESIKNFESENIKSCLACERGDKPSGVHVCFHCNVAVHIIGNCSFSIQDMNGSTNEGTGQKRICYKCHSSGNKTHYDEKIEEPKIVVLMSPFTRAEIWKGANAVNRFDLRNLFFRIFLGIYDAYWVVPLES